MKFKPSPLLRLCSRSTGARPVANHTSFFTLSLGMAVVGLVTFGSPSAWADSQTWDGGTLGTGTTLQTTTNWSSDLAVPTSGQIATFSNLNGTGGNLALTFDATFTGGSSGVSLYVSALHTGSLAIDSTVTNTGFRFKDLTIEAGAGAVTFGNGDANTFNLNFGSLGSTHALTNNSSNTVTFKSDLRFANGGAASTTTKTLTFDGSGNWQVDAVLKPTTSNAAGTFIVSKKGAGSLALNANNTGNNTNGNVTGLQSITIEQGSILAGATGALGGGGGTVGAGVVTLGPVAGGTNSASLLNTGAFTQANNITVASGNTGTLTLGGNHATGTSVYTGNVALGSNVVLSAATGGAVNFTTGVISGGGGVTVSGGGTIGLSGTNTYSGATNVTGGTLVLSGAGAINSSSITINGSGAKLIQTSSVAGTSAITLTQGTLDGTGTVGAVTLGTGGAILANGNGTSSVLTTGALSFGGAATINLRSGAGISIAAGALTTSGTDGAIVVNINRTAVWSNGVNDLISFISLTSPDINDFQGGAITGTTLGPRQTLGALTFNGNNLAIQVDGTSVYWTGASSNQWTTAAAQNWKTTSDNTATSFLTGDDVVFNDTPGTSQTVSIDDANVSTSTMTFNNSAAVNYTIASAGSFGITGGALTKSGTGALTLNTSNTYAGGTTLNAGTLNLGNASALGTGALTITGGTLDNTSGSAMTNTGNNAQNWNGDFTFTGSNNLDLGSGAVALGGSGDRTVAVTANSTLTVGEIKSSSQGLVISGAGTLVATSIGDFTAASSIGGTLNVGGGATLQINRSTGNNAATTGDFVATGLTGSGTIKNGAAHERWLIVNTNTSNTFAGTLANGGTGALGLNKLGTGSLTLTGSSSYTGPTTVSTGILNVQNSNALGASRVSLVTRTGGLQLQGGITLPDTVTFLTSNDGTGAGATGYAIANVSGNNTINGKITMTLGGGSTIIESQSGALTLAGEVTSDSARTLILQGASTSANAVSGVISNGTAGTNSVTKTGTGTWTLSGASTYTGATTVSAGTLLVNGSLGNTAVAVNAGTLGGIGTIAGSVTVGAATYAPGASPGSLEIAGNLTLGSGSTTGIELGGTAFTLNGTEDYDRTKLTGVTPVLSLSGALAVGLFGGFTPEDNQAFGIFQLGSGATLTGFFTGLGEDAVVGTFGGKDLYITYQGDFGDTGPVATFGGNDIVLYSIPEPSAAALGALGMLMLLRRRQR